MTSRKELGRIPRTLSERNNEALIARLYDIGGNVGVDLIIFLANKQYENLFGESWFSIDDFCKKMGYDRTALHRKLSAEQLSKIFGTYKPIYKFVDDGIEIDHPIENIFEAALYRLGKENISLPVRSPSGSTSYNFVQILTQFEIKTNFLTRKGSKRMYCVSLNKSLINTLFTEYNLIEFKDYRALPDRTGYRLFYLLLAKLIIVINYKINKNQDPIYTLTVDELASIFNLSTEVNKERKRNVKKTLDRIRKYLKFTKFNYEFVKGEGEKWAYTVQFSFDKETLEYFNEKFYAVFTNRFYNTILYDYVKTIYPGLQGIAITRKQEEYLLDPKLKDEFLDWLYSPKNKEIKKKSYRNVFYSVFQQWPEDLGLTDFSFHAP